MDIHTAPLYKFFNNQTGHFEDAMTKLAEGKIWCSKVGSLNDPWEGIAPIEERIPDFMEFLAREKGYGEAGIKNFREAPEKSLHLIRNQGIYSCSMMVDDEDPLQNKLLWSHYGNGGHGVCIEFRTFAIHLSGGYVQYHDDVKPIGMEALDLLFPNGDGVKETNDFMRLALFQKPKCWKYENEYRFLSSADGYVSLTSCPVSAIYFGPRAKDSLKKRLKDIFLPSNEVTLFETRIEKFQLSISIVV